MEMRILSLQNNNTWLQQSGASVGALNTAGTIECGLLVGDCWVAVNAPLHIVEKVSSATGVRTYYIAEPIWLGDDLQEECYVALVQHIDNDIVAVTPLYVPEGMKLQEWVTTYHYAKTSESQALD